MKSTLIKYSILLLVSCSSLPSKKLILIPETTFRVNQNILRTDGYYYSEKTREDYCKLVPYASGVVADPSSKFEEKFISAFVLYADGYAYYTGGLINSGVDQSSLDFCDDLASKNTFDRAREVFESRLDRYSTKRHDDKHDRGVFALSGDAIRFQIYETGFETPQLIEYEGVILNDSTFRLNNRRHHKRSRKSENQMLNDTYRFKKYKNKPDSISYIRDHRAKFTSGLR